MPRNGSGTEHVVRRGIDRSGLVAAVLLAVVLGMLGWVRHRNYWSGAFDLGIFDQAVWQLSQGRAHVSLVDRNIFADHISPVLFIFVPLYWIAATPLWLIGVQAAALGATVLPMRALARDVGVRPWVATALVCISAPLFAAATFDFHPGTLAVPWVAMLVLQARRDNRVWALVAALVIVACRADLGAVIVAAAVVAGPRSRVPLVATGVGGAVLGSALPSLFGGVSGWALHYGHLGSGPADAAAHPWRLVEALLDAGSIRPLVTWVLAAGCLVVLRPRWMLALVVAGLPVLVSRWGATDLPWFHYGAPVAPIAIAGTIVALDPDLPRWRSFTELRPAALVAGVLIALMLASPLSSGAPDQFRFWDVIRPAPGRDSAAALAFVREGDIVSADNQLVPHLSHRQQIFMFPITFEAPEGFLQGGVVPDLSAYPRGVVDVVVAPAGTSINGYRQVGRVEGFVILRRR